jgi:hypothetical protein
MNIYLDQNIIGYLHEGVINLPIGNGCDYVYSNEHFNEIARGENTSYLEVLKELRARQVQLVSDDNFRITEQAQVHEYSCPFERYDRHLAATSEVEFDDSLFTGFLGRLFGGDNFEEIRFLPEGFKIQVEQLLSPHGELTPQLQDLLQKISTDLSEMIETQLDQTRPLETLRKPLGTSNGRIGNPKSENPILEIWDIINNRYPDQTIDQFFGFDPIEKQGYENWPTYLGIVGCHTILNMVGYRTDKESATPQIPKIL